MKYQRFAISVIGFWLMFSFFHVNCYAQTQAMKNNEELKRACINAAIQGIKLEIKRNRGWLEHADKDKTKDIENRIKQLENESVKYETMNIDKYEIPSKLEKEVWFEGPCNENSILYFDGMSRSGPWYHVTGIRGNDYKIFKPKNRYRFSFYLVYPREYGNMTSYYVYIDQFKETSTPQATRKK